MAAFPEVLRLKLTLLSGRPLFLEVPNVPWVETSTLIQDHFDQVRQAAGDLCRYVVVMVGGRKINCDADWTNAVTAHVASGNNVMTCSCVLMDAGEALDEIQESYMTDLDRARRDALLRLREQRVLTDMEQTELNALNQKNIDKPTMPPEVRHQEHDLKVLRDRHLLYNDRQYLLDNYAKTSRDQRTNDLDQLYLTVLGDTLKKLPGPNTIEEALEKEYGPINEDAIKTAEKYVNDLNQLQLEPHTPIYLEDVETSWPMTTLAFVKSHCTAYATMPHLWQTMLGTETTLRLVLKAPQFYTNTPFDIRSAWCEDKDALRKLEEVLSRHPLLSDPLYSLPQKCLRESLPLAKLFVEVDPYNFFELTPDTVKAHPPIAEMFMAKALTQDFVDQCACKRLLAGQTQDMVDQKLAEYDQTFASNTPRFLSTCRCAGYRFLPPDMRTEDHFREFIPTENHFSESVQRGTRKRSASTAALD